MKLIDLTMPIWQGAGYGEVLPYTNSPVQFFEYMDYGKNGMRMTRMKLDGETGSPFMVATQNAPFDMRPIQPAPKYTQTLNQIPLAELVLHETVIIDVPAAEGHEITSEEMDKAIRQSDYRGGDQVLLRTGWGNLDKAYDMGIDYWRKSPSVLLAAGVLLAEKMDAMNSRIFMTDCGLVNPPRLQGNDWFTGQAPMRPVPKPWPSSEARERVLDMQGSFTYPHKSKEPSSYGALIKKIIAGCKCLVNCNQISRPRVKMIIVPLRIDNGGASPCRFIAVEE
jgi:kynurenine formamidase